MIRGRRSGPAGRAGQPDVAVTGGGSVVARARREEVEDLAVEGVGAFPHRIVGGALDDHQPRAGYDGHDRAPDADRADPVVLAPYDEGRCLDPGQLGPPVRPQQLRRGLDEADGAGADGVPGEHRQQRRRGPAYGPDGARDAVPEVRVERKEASVDQHQPVDPIGVVGGQAGGDQAAHRVPDDAGALDAQSIHRRDQLGGRIVEHEASLALRGAEAGQVDGMDLERAFERRGVAPPPECRPGQAMEQDERRALAADIRDDRPMLRPGPAAGLGRGQLLAPIVGQGIGHDDGQLLPLRHVLGVVGRERRDDAHAARIAGLVDDRLAFDERPHDVGQLVGMREVDGVGGAIDGHERRLRQLPDSEPDALLADQWIPVPQHDQHRDGGAQEALDGREGDHRAEERPRLEDAVVQVVPDGDGRHAQRFSEAGQGELPDALDDRPVVGAAGGRDEDGPFDAIGMLGHEGARDRAAQRVAQQRRLVELDVIHEARDGIGQGGDAERVCGMLAAPEAGQVGDVGLVEGRQARGRRQQVGAADAEAMDMDDGRRAVRRRDRRCAVEEAQAVEPGGDIPERRWIVGHGDDRATPL